MFQRKDTNSDKRKITAVITAVMVILLTAVVVFFVSDAFYKTDEHFGYSMGSEIIVVFDRGNNKEIADTLFSRINNLDTKGISRKSADSEIYALNKNGSHELSEEILGYMKQAADICETSGGALDVTIGGLSSLWDFDSSNSMIPDITQIETEKSFCGYEKMTFNGYTVTLGENQTVDMGALGKGIACDVAKNVFEENNVKKALLSVGGTVMTYSDEGYSWGNHTWGIAVRTPETEDSSPLLRINLTENKVISTSGNYEKFFEENGMLYHHILDPKTGFPSDSDLKSVTIIADSGLISDALSTACFVLGKENSASLLEKYNAQAIFVDSENNVYITSGIIGSCTVLNDNYRILSYE